MPRQIGWKPRLIHPTSATSTSLSGVSALAELLFWRLLPQSDDQGRLPANPKLLKAIACPMRDEISVEHIPSLVEELQKGGLIIQYDSSSGLLLQLRNWWTYQAPQWAYPSKYPPPQGWEDHLRYRKAREVITENWPPERLPKTLPKALGKALPNPSNVQEEEEEEKEKEEVEVEGEAVVEGVGTNYSHSNTQTIKTNQYMAALVKNYRAEIGTVSPTISRELAEFAEQLNKAKAPLPWIDEAFAEAATNNKRNWAYVRAILNAWIGKGKAGKTKTEEQVEREWREKQKRALEQESSAE